MKKILTVLLAAMITTASVISAYAAEPIAIFPLEKDAKDTVNGYEGSLLGEAAFETVGDELALRLAKEESQYVTGLQLPAEIFTKSDFTQGLTISGDFYLTAFKNDWTRAFQLGNSQSQFANISIGLSLRLKATTGSEVGSYGSVADITVLDPVYNGTNYTYLNSKLEQWFNFAVTVGKDAAVLYLNGVPVVRYDSPDDAGIKAFLEEANTFALNYVGYSYWEADYDLQGAVKNVKLWNVELTEAEVKANTSREFKATEQLETLKPSVFNPENGNPFVKKSVEEDPTFMDDYGIVVIAGGIVVVLFVVIVIVATMSKKKKTDSDEE